jgi:ethanolamine transporter EutH
MIINELFIYMILTFILIGAVDHVFGNRWGIGEQFVEGLKTMGTLALAMIGIVSLAPVIANILSPVIVPLFTAFGADPSIFATMLLPSLTGLTKSLNGMRINQGKYLIPFLHSHKLHHMLTLYFRNQGDIPIKINL